MAKDMVVWITIVWCVLSSVYAIEPTAVVERYQSALAKTEATLQQLSDEWQIPKYPNFLKSCFMHKSSWEVMKHKFMTRALEAAVQQQRTRFVASFTGSSVTAGHDSHYNFSTPLVTGDIVRAAFAAGDIDFVTRNVALGNNPCMPYDVCVKYFVGVDADLVHWEQNYFCDGSPLMEQFIRQAMTIPTRPIVIFSESQTGHWEPEKCKPDPHVVTSAEKELLNADPIKLVSELNKDEYHRGWGTVSQLAKHYHGAALQTFTHLKHEDYACLGPYIKTWMAGAASWHPSIIGHRLRASHHAYFWLLVWKDALKDMIKQLTHNRSPDAMLQDSKSYLDKSYVPLEAPVHKLQFLDDMKCNTDYEPRAERGVSLKNIAISGLTNDENAKGWKFIIYEDLVDKNLVLRSKQQNYADFKWLMYSKDNDIPLSLSVSTKRDGPLFICQTPGIWGALPKGYSHLWEDTVDVYLTKNVQSKDGFTFDAAKAEKLTITHDKMLDICIELESPTEQKKFKAGEHVLTIAPKPDKKVILAWLLTA